MKKLFYLSVLALMISALFYCSPDSDMGVLPGTGDVGTFSTPIFNGFAPDSPEHDAVVALHHLSKDGASVYVSPFCSGTLVAPDVVVTAAHCLDVAKNSTKPSFSTIKPTALAVYVGDDPSADILQHMYFVSETMIYPGYNRLALRNDIAIIRLKRSIAEPVIPVPNLTDELGFTQNDVGTMINMAGFGQTETGESGIKLQVDVALGSLGCHVAGCPDSGDNATQIAYAQSEAGPCFGDSGGPAFVYRADGPYLGGVTSYGDSNCTLYGVSTRVDAFAAWINEFANGPVQPDCSDDDYCNPDCSQGEDPDCSITPTPPPTNDCGNNVCDSGESCDGRYNTVSCSADCPGKITGKPSGRFCYVGDLCEGPGC